MARTAEQMPRRFSWFDSGAFAHAAVPSLGADNVRGTASESLTARAIAYSGLAALFVLPMLLLASVLLGVPLAAPAAIALGYLASSYALACDHPRSAAAINGVVLLALVAWAAGVLVAGDGVSRIAVAAALLAPCFAAAPAFARIAITPRIDRAAGSAERNAACLDRLAPKEAVLVVRRDGVLLAATRAAQAILRLPAGTESSDVSCFFALTDRPKIASAIARCQVGEAPVTITVRGDKGWASPGKEGNYAAEVAADGDGTVSVRLATVVRRRPRTIKLSRPEKRPRGPCVDAGPVCDLSEAVDFALRHAGPAAEARRVLLTADVEPALAAICDRHTCRRLLCLMMEGAVAQSSSGHALHLTGRALKSVVLLRLVGGSVPDDESVAGDLGRGVAHVALRHLVEEAGGTLVVDQAAGEIRISVRLDLAVAQAKETKGVARGGRR